MKVHALKTLSAKLFYVMVALVLITIAGSTLQSSITLRRHISEESQDTLQMQVENAAGQFESVIDNWQTLVTGALPTFRATDPKDLNAAIQKIISTNNELVGLQIFETPGVSSSAFTEMGSALTLNTDDQRFEDRVPTKVWISLQNANKKWLLKNINRFKKDPIAIVNASRNVKLPLLNIVMRHESSDPKSDPKKVTWTVLTAWQSDLIKTLPKSQYVNSAVIDDDSRTITSPSLGDMIASKSFKNVVLARNAVAASTGSGFEGDYKGNDQRRKLGAFMRLSKLGLSVLVERDYEATYRAISDNVIWTIVWGLLFILIAVMLSILATKRISKKIQDITAATGHIASGDFTRTTASRPDDEIGILGESVNKMSRRMVQMMQSQTERSRQEKDAETSRLVKAMLFPQQDFKSDALGITGFYQPATACGGDLWGRYTIRSGVELIFIADVMGRGTSAALVASMVYATCKTMAEQFKDDENSYQKNIGEIPTLLLTHVNQLIYQTTGGQISVTCFAAILDTHRGVMSFANAGHNFPILLSASGDDPRATKVTRNKKLSLHFTPISLQLRGSPLGMEAVARFETDQIELKAGDKIFFFTDGLIECSSPEGNVWGRKLLIEQLVTIATLDGNAMKKELVSRAFAFFGAKPIEDDVTIVIAEIDKEWRPVPTFSQISHEIMAPTVVSLPTPPIPMEPALPPSSIPALPQVPGALPVMEALSLTVTDIGNVTDVTGVTNETEVAEIILGATDTANNTVVSTEETIEQPAPSAVEDIVDQIVALELTTPETETVATPASQAVARKYRIKLPSVS